MNITLQDLKLIKSIIEPMKDGVFIIDNAGYYVVANKAFEEITGIKRNKLIDKHTKYLLEKEWVKEAVNLDVLRNHVCKTKIVTYPSGKQILVTADIIWLDNGVSFGVISCLRDVSKLQILEEQIIKSNLLLKHCKLKLDDLEDKIHVDGESYIAQSTECRRILEYSKKVAHSDATILINGESGTGKDFIARYIHKCSKRKMLGDFVKVDCAALPLHLLEAELFGYEKGAFTDARIEGKPGMFEIANNGTLFLDEVAEIPMELQSKLLTTLQDRKIKRVGGIKQIPINIRIICATNQNLREMVRMRKFREDLYYRLNVVPIYIQPLRERREDILPLVKHFLTFFNNEYNLKKVLSHTLLTLLINYSWPGNTRQLKNIIERLVVTSSGDLITINNLTDETMHSDLIVDEKTQSQKFIPQQYNSLKESLNTYEREVIKKALKDHGNLEDAARNLKISLATLVRKNKKYNLKGYTRNVE